MGQACCVRWLCNRRLRLKKIERTSCRTNCFLIDAEQGTERADCACDVERVQKKRDKCACGERAIEHEPSALPQYRDYSAKCAEGKNSEERRPDSRAVHR